MTRNFAAVLAFVATMPLLIARGAGQAPAAPVRTPPPNEPALVDVANGRIVIRYHGGVIFDGRVSGSAGLARATVNTYRTGTAIDQVIALTASSSAGPLEVSGTVTGSAEAFPAEADRPLRGLPIVRHSSGRSRVVGGDPYEIYVTVPSGYALDEADCSGVPAEIPVREGSLARLVCRPATSREMAWSVSFRRP